MKRKRYWIHLSWILGVALLVWGVGQSIAAQKEIPPGQEKK
jgi:hypothetical protein